MTAPTTALVLMTSRAERRILSCLEAVTREEARSVHIGAARVIEMPLRRQGRNMAAPLSQLAPIDPDESTAEAIGDWHYWVARGYLF